MFNKKVYNTFMALAICTVKP